MQTFGGFLSQLRRERRFTLGQLSLQSGLNKATLSRWEAGTYLPRIPELNRVLDALDAPTSARAQSLRLLDTPRAIHAERQNASALIRVSMGDALFGLRQRAGKTQAETARASGVSRSLYSQWENDAGQPDASQLHTVGFALGASADEISMLSSATLAQTPLEQNRDALLRRYMEVLDWHEGVTEASHQLHLWTLLANLGRLVKADKAHVGDIALIVSQFGDSAETWRRDANARNAYHRRALALSAQAQEPLHFHLIPAINVQLLAPGAPGSLKERVAAAHTWRARFRDKAGQAYLLSFIAKAIAEEAPDEALRLADRYCALVADNPDEFPCRLRDRGNLLLKCGRPAESVAFIAALTPQDSFRAGLQQLEMARGLLALGSLGEARRCFETAKRILSATDQANVRSMIDEFERALS